MNFRIQSVIPKLFKKTLLATMVSASIAQPVWAELTFTGGGTQAGDMVIDASQGVTNGANLLHSFDVFNVQLGESATFTGPNAIDNIIARVTGTQSSLINGLLQSTITSADLFLINPNGVMFGAGAQIEVDGGLYVSTANSLTFADGSQLLISDTGSSGFSAAAPSAFGFDVQPADITFTQTNIETAQTAPNVFADAPVDKLSIVGGDLVFDRARVFLSESEINLVSVGSAGTINITAPNTLADAPLLGDITIAGDPADVDVRLDTSGAPAGRISILANNLTMTDQAFIFADTTGTSAGAGIDVSLSGDVSMASGSRITTDVLSDGIGSNLSVAANNINLTGTNTKISSDNRSLEGTGGAVSLTASAVNLADTAQISATTLGNGDAGSIQLTVGSLDINTGAAISGQTIGSGTGSAITITATGDIQLTGSGSGISSSTVFDQGDAGPIVISARDLTVADEAGILARSETFFAGAPGSITLYVRSLELTGLGQISTENSSETGAGGAVSIDADTIFISGADADFPDLIFSGISSSATDVADGGAVNITANELRIEDGGAVTVTTLFNVGNAGSVSITGDVFLDGSRIDTRTDTEGLGGAIAINGDVSLTNGASINTSTTGAESFGIDGDAGQILISGNLLSVDASSITSNTAGSGNAGLILLDSGLSITQGASVNTNTTSTDASAGDAGFISVSGSSLAISGAGSSLSSSTVGSGAAGLVTVESAKVDISAGGKIDTSTTQAGEAGDIFVNSPVFSITGAGSQITSRTDGAAAGGSISISSTDLTVSKGAAVTVTALGSGNAGNIQLLATHNLDVLDGGNIETNAALSGGGNINIDVVNRIYFRDSTVTASSGGPATGDDGGNITIDPIFFILDDSRIVAQAVQGNGGIINLFANNFISDVNSLISATSELGNDGEVTITSPDNSVTGVIGTLEANLSSDEALLNEPCAARVLDTRSSLVVARASNVGSAPDDYQVTTGVSCR